MIPKGIPQHPVKTTDKKFSELGLSHSIVAAVQIERPRDAPNHVIHRGSIQMVEEIETFRHELDRPVLAESYAP